MSAETDRAFHIERAEQCRKMAADAVDQARRDTSINALFWYTNQDLDLPDRRERSFGLRRLDGVPKPAWAAFRTAVGSP